MPPSAIGHRDRAGCTECNNGTFTDADGGGVLKWREEKAYGERKYGGKRYGKWQSLLPHGWTCSLNWYLREVVMDFIVENKMELMKENVLMNAPGGVLNDVLAAVARSEAKAGTAGKTDEVELGTLGISELRRRAYAHGLCVDGSRETLIAALESKTVVLV